jgi:hypothetical protein
MTGTDHTGKAGSGGELHMQAMAFPTPTAKDADGSRDTSSRPGSKRHKGKTLTDATANLWQTPGTDSFRSRGGDRKDEQGLDQQAREWPTPRVRSTLGDTASSERLKEGPCPGLNDAAASWATPTGSDLSSPREQTKGGRSLMTDVEKWPTPVSNPDAPNLNSNQKNGAASLGKAAEVWPTPNARDHKGSDLSSRNGGASLSHFAETGERTHGSPPSSPQVQVISVHGGELSPTDPSTVLRRRLNPAFVCWLMGLPWWWMNPAEISFAGEATRLYLFKLRTLLSSLLGEQGSSR